MVIFCCRKLSPAVPGCHILYFAALTHGAGLRDLGVVTSSRNASIKTKVSEKPITARSKTVSHDFIGGKAKVESKPKAICLSARFCFGKKQKEEAEVVLCIGTKGAVDAALRRLLIVDYSGPACRFIPAGAGNTLCL